MKFSPLCLAAMLMASMTTMAYSEEACLNDNTSSLPELPFVTAKVTLHGIVHSDLSSNANATTSSRYDLVDVPGCCAPTSTSNDETLTLVPQTIGQMAQMNAVQTTQILEDAKQAWNGGMGVWPQMSLPERLVAIDAFLTELTRHREMIVTSLMWEIGKHRKDAESEFDRTITFCRQVMDVARNDPEYIGGGWQTIGTTKAFVRRAAIGILMCLGPMNYPLNETYATLIPALLMGNVAIMKIPTIGGLAHLLTMEAFAKTLPPGAMNFVSGRGRDTMPHLMKTGDIDALAFIGGSKAADDLIRQHPQPHRLKVFLQLEAKNMGIFLPDMFDPTKRDTELSNALDQAMTGALSFNGQRCTALKLFFVPKSHGEDFAQQVAKRVEAKTVGLPWELHTSSASASASASYSEITPLPGKKRIDYMQELIQDAVAKGAAIVNTGGGTIIGGPESTLMNPAVLYPVTPDMRIYHEEQFGPIVPIAVYDDEVEDGSLSSLDSIVKIARDGIYGQQVSIFVSDQETSTATKLLDMFSSIYGKININSQCGRSPDTLPFSGRRSSAMGVMSVTDALKEFSIPTVISYKESATNTKIVNHMESKSKFLETR